MDGARIAPRAAGPSTRVQRTPSGEVAVAGRSGRDRLWDLDERVYHSDIPTVPLEEALRIRDERRLRSLGVVRNRTPDLPVETTRVGERLVGGGSCGSVVRRRRREQVVAAHRELVADRRVRLARRQELRALVVGTELSKSKIVKAANVADGSVGRMRRVRKELKDSHPSTDLSALTWHKAQRLAEGKQADENVDWEARIEQEAQEMAVGQ